MERTRLAAYVDGNLEPEEAAAVVMHLADTPEDQAYVDSLLGMNRILNNAFGSATQEPVPPRILDAIFPPQKKAVRPKWRFRFEDWFAPTGLSALAAVLLIVFFGFYERPAVTEGLQTGAVSSAGAFHDILENNVSGFTGEIKNEGIITLIAVFYDQDGRPCREYEIQQYVGEVMTRGIACREVQDDDATWDIAMTASEQMKQFVDGASGYVPADGPSYSAVSVALDTLGAGPGLSPEEERQLLSNNWN